MPVSTCATACMRVGMFLSLVFGVGGLCSCVQCVCKCVWVPCVPVCRLVVVWTVLHSMWLCDCESPCVHLHPHMAPCLSCALICWGAAGYL